jgi:putative FmdB family regulatory protein
MPIYEFICKKCGNRFETLVRTGSGKAIVCPTCECEDVRKLFSSFGIGGGSSRPTSSSSSCSTCSSKSCSTCH